MSAHDIDRPGKLKRGFDLAGALLKRARHIGPVSTIREAVNYTSRYNRILKKNDSYSRRYALINWTYYGHIVQAFPAISRKDVLDYVPYTLGYAIYIKHHIDRDRHTHDKANFYSTAVEHGISIPTTFGFTDETGALKWLMADETEFERQSQANHIIAKPRRTNYGIGVMENITDHTLKNYIYQERAVDHPAIADLTQSPYCSTVRFAVFNRNGEMIPVGSVIRLNVGKLIDNWISGSISAGLDVKTGKINKYGMNQHYKHFTHHPVSGKDIIGFQVPHWDKLLREAEKVCRVYKDLPFIGIDFAISEDRPMILEINGGGQIFEMQFENKLFNHPVFQENLEM